MITLIADNKEIPIEWIEFSDGALTCKVNPIIKETKCYISLTIDPSTPCKQIESELELVVSAIENLDFKNYNIKSYLNMDYLPYARADRVFEEGNPSPLHEFLCNIENYNFDAVLVCDPHNEEYIQQYGINWEIKSQLQCFKERLLKHNPKYNYIIAPDKGAKEKAKSIADYFGFSLVQATKVRDISTGRIIETTLDVDLPVGSSVIIVDDICDGGGTFIPLAEKLCSQGCTVDLYVTHLIASKGLDLFEGLIDNIYCYHTVGKYVNHTDVLNFNLGK